MALDTFNPYLFVSAGEQSNKYLTPVISPDGIASFQAQRAQDLTGLTVRIDPIQEGSGDPAPDNIRPISGRTGLTVTRSGKNLLALPASAITTNGVTVEATSDGELWVHGTPTIASGYISFNLPQLPEVVVDKTVSISINEKMAGIGVVFGAGNGTLNLTLAGTETYKTGVYTSGSRTPAINVRYDVGAINKKFQIQLEIASAPSAFVPYVATTTYPITWQTEAGTVYGGTLDVVSGVLTVDRAIATITRDVYASNWFSHDASYSTWGFYCNNDTRWRDFIGDIPIGGLISDRFPTVIMAYLSDSTCCSLTTQNGVMSYMAFRIPKTAIATPTDSNDLSEKIKNWLDSNPIQVCFEIEPQTYQLTPTEVRTIAGFNQIYSDAGPVIDIKF